MNRTNDRINSQGIHCERSDSNQAIFVSKEMISLKPKISDCEETHYNSFSPVEKYCLYNSHSCKQTDLK